MPKYYPTIQLIKVTIRVSSSNASRQTLVGLNLLVFCCVTSMLDTFHCVIHCVQRPNWSQELPLTLANTAVLIKLKTVHSVKSMLTYVWTMAVQLGNWLHEHCLLLHDTSSTELPSYLLFMQSLLHGLTLTKGK